MHFTLFKREGFPVIFKIRYLLFLINYVLMTKMSVLSSLVPHKWFLVAEAAAANGHIHQCDTKLLSSPYRTPFFGGACLKARWVAGPFQFQTKWLSKCWRPSMSLGESEQNTKHDFQCISWCTLSKWVFSWVCRSWGNQQLLRMTEEIKHEGNVRTHRSSPFDSYPATVSFSPSWTPSLFKLFTKTEYIFWH